MAVYTRVDDVALASFLAHYDLPEPTMFKGIAEGVENSNYILETAGTRYILTLYEKRVDENDLPYFLSLMDHVVEHGVPAAGPVTDRNGDILKTLCGRPAALIEFLEGTSPKVPNVNQARAAGTAMGKLHLATGNFTSARTNTLGPQGWVDLTTKLADRLDEIENSLFAELRDTCAALQAQWPSGLPSGTIHADLFPDNVLFLGDDVSGVIDFYFACTDFYVYDLAVSMNAWTEEGTIDPTVALAFRRGYEDIRPLTETETEALPLLLQGSAVRFLLTRAHDFLHQVPGSLVRVKDPVPYLNLARHHRDHPFHFTKA